MKGLKHMKDITDKLAAIGAPISEEDQVVKQPMAQPAICCLLECCSLLEYLLGTQR